MPYLEETVASETETSYTAQALHTMEKRIAELGEVTERLMSRLAPLLSPDVPVYADESKVALATERRSPHVESLESLSGRIGQLTFDVRSTIERLDV